MRDTIVSDSRFAEGRTVRVASQPDRIWKIDKYLSRIYYCTPVDDPNHEQRAFFERELILQEVK
jgi:hypothetical protein